MVPCSLLSLVLALLSSDPRTARTAEADTWPQWRGPSRDGRVVAGPGWPDGLESLEEAWEAGSLGPSYSGPIVTAERVFTTATEGESEEVVRAYRRDDGELVWEARWKGSMTVPFFAAKNGSWIRSTPAFDGDALYVAGMRDVLVCLDAESGKERWRVDFPAELGTPLPSFGFVSSPLVDGDALFVQAAASLIRLDKRTGAIEWRALVDEDPAGGMDSAFSSPVVATLGGVRQLVVQTRTELCGVSVDEGELLWSTPVRAFRGMNILTPSVDGEGVFTAAYGGRSQRFVVARGEDGFVVEADWDANPQGHMTSPVLVDGHAYFFTRANRFTCLDLATGETRWTSPPTGDEYWSLVVRDDRILALANTGRLILLRARPEAYEVLSEREVAAEETWAHLAVAGDELFVRSSDALLAFTWR